jgi:hypothetical protein
MSSNPAVEMKFCEINEDGKYGTLVHVTRSEFVFPTLHDLIAKNMGRRMVIGFLCAKGNQLWFYKTKVGGLITGTRPPMVKTPWN